MSVDSKTGFLRVIDTEEEQPCYFYEKDGKPFAEPMDGMYDMYDEKGQEFTEDFENHCYSNPVELGVAHVYNGLAYVFVAYGDDCDKAMQEAFDAAVRSSTSTQPSTVVEVEKHDLLTNPRRFDRDSLVVGKLATLVVDADGEQWTVECIVEDDVVALGSHTWLPGVVQKDANLSNTRSSKCDMYVEAALCNVNEDLLLDGYVYDREAHWELKFHD